MPAAFSEAVDRFPKLPLEAVPVHTAVCPGILMPLVSPVFNLLRLCWRKSRLPQNRIYQIPDLDIIGGLCAFQHGLKHCKKCLVTFLFWRTQVLMSCHGRRVKTQPWNTKKSFGSCSHTFNSGASGEQAVAGPQFGAHHPVQVASSVASVDLPLLSPYYSSRLLATTCQDTLVACLVICPGPPFW